MSRYERLIKIAVDKVSGEIFDADEVFHKTKDAFEIRRKYHNQEFLPVCCECDQDLTVSDSKRDRLHFKHKPGHSYCFLTDDTISPQEHEKVLEVLRRESERHKQLKNRIGSLLQKIDGVDEVSIAIDNKFIIRGDEKRRPDVYCKYYDKELVFEIQLSDLPLRYIKSRYDFYKKHGMYLIWILDNFDIHNQGTLEKDIKYLAKHQNFFKLDEKVTEILTLECEYKDVLITEANKLLTIWQKKSITLHQVQFDDECYQIYFCKFDDNKAEAEIQQKKRAEEIELEKKRAAAKKRQQYAESKANNIIEEIKRLRDRKVQNFADISIQISVLDEYELEVLNSCLEFTKKSPIIRWLSTATQNDIAFLEFVLGCNEIDLDVNATDQDGKTAFQVIYENKNVFHQYVPVKLLFQRGYKLTEADKTCFLRRYPLEQDEDRIHFKIYEFCNELIDKTLVDSVFTYERQLRVIESVKQRKMIGFGYQPNGWVALANNAIDNYFGCWEYIELAFKKFGLWDTLIKLDKKGTFTNKHQAFYSKKPKQDSAFEKVLKELYPELGSLENNP